MILQMNVKDSNEKLGLAKTLSEEQRDQLRELFCLSADLILWENLLYL